MSLNYYYDLMSQPSRAVYMFLNMNKVPYVERPVAMRKGHHHSDEFKKINPFHAVPAMEDDGFTLTESIAISKYVINKFNLPDHWFPKDLKKQAKVEEYLHWQHFNTRFICAMLFQQLLLIPKATGKKTDPEIVEVQRDKVSRVVSKLESYFLRDTPFLAGNELSLADIFGACELMQLYACHEEKLYEASPKVKAWMMRVRQETNPYFDEAHVMTYKARERFHEVVSKL